MSFQKIRINGVNMMIGELIIGIYQLIVYFFLFIIAIFLFAAAIYRIKEKFIDKFGNELKNSDEQVRKAYVMKLDDEKLLKEVALTDLSEDVAIHAVERIRDKSILEEISNSNKKSVSNIAKMRMEF